MERASEKFLAERNDLYRKMDLVSKAVIDMMMDVKDFYSHLDQLHDQRLQMELKRKLPISDDVLCKLPLIVSEYFRISPTLKGYEKKTWIHSITIDDMRREQLNPNDKKPKTKGFILKGQITMF